MAHSGLRLGIIGLGMAGSGIIPAVMRHPHVILGGASTREPQRREQFQRDFHVPVFATPEELCRSDAVDVVYIATPTELYTEHVLIAARHHKHIIVEKPMAISMADAETMIAAVQSAGVVMVVGHSHSFEAPIRKMREVVASGQLGKVRMIHNWMFNDWLYRPRTPEELDTRLGGGITFRQGAHQFDIIRLIGGGLLRSVRAMTGIWDPNRPTEGSQTVFLEFEDRTVATAVYSGYDHFHSAELTYGIGEWGDPVPAHVNAASRRRLAQVHTPGEEQALKTGHGYGTPANPLSQTTPHQPFFGLTLVSCEHGDLRQSPDGIWLYDDEGQRELPLDKSMTGRDALLQELYAAVALGQPPTHDVHWGRATLEVSLAVLESSRQRREIFLQYQTAVKA